MLNPRLQDGKKLPKWTPRARRGQFLGYSPQHSTLVGRILNLSTGSVTPQFHVVYDDLFSTVTCPVDSPLPESSWNSLLSFGYENCLHSDVPVPPLSLEWLSPAEVADNQRTSCGSQGFGSPGSLDVLCGPLQVSEGEKVPGPVGICETFPEPADEASELEPNEVPSPEGAGAQMQPTLEGTGAGEQVQPTLKGTTTTVVTRSGRQIKRNRRFFGDQWTTYHSGHPRQKVSGAILNQRFLNSLSWNMSHDALYSMSSS